MTRPLTVAILLISIVPLFAQGQQPNVAKLKADAQKVVGGGVCSRSGKYISERCAM